ncbi:hypothetical protein VNO80_01058 [Phaseolus coccineus]|uniref:Uncharacterized protein n=1 Tax=Phaseolus coccineus TaxID=3886 RepID=A0AAN9NZH9_PHACN
MAPNGEDQNEGQGNLACNSTKSEETKTIGKNQMGEGEKLLQGGEQTMTLANSVYSRNQYGMNLINIENLDPVIFEELRKLWTGESSKACKPEAKKKYQIVCIMEE